MDQINVLDDYSFDTESVFTGFQYEPQPPKASDYNFQLLVNHYNRLVESHNALIEKVNKLYVSYDE